jgi:hypothetical protein
MPIHYWTRVPAGLFHHFHQSWSIRIADALNAGRLPKGFSALVEQRSGQRETDVLAIEHRAHGPKDAEDSGATIATLPRPNARIVRQSTKALYARRANRIVVKHHLGRTIAVIEIVSPGNKDGRAALREFVTKSIEFLRRGVHLVVIDLFPPSSRDPFGIHKAIWDEIEEEDFSLPAGKDRTLASYEASARCLAYVEPVGVGDSLPDMPLFLSNDLHVAVPMEATYQVCWDACPEEFRIAVETGVIPEPDAE